MPQETIRAHELDIERPSAIRAPCWRIMRCPDNIKAVCPAPRNRSMPCWQIEGTYVKLDDRNADGCDTSACARCPVYRQFGLGSPLIITLYGQGINTSLTHRS